MAKYIILLLLPILFCALSLAQTRTDPFSVNSECDTFGIAKDSIPRCTPRAALRKMAVPAVLIGAGTAGMAVRPIRKLDLEVQDMIAGRTPFKADDYLQYAPAVAVYVLNLTPLKGKDNFVDRTAVLATSFLGMTLTVNVLKYSTKVLRPDGSAYNSFPSGHTAMAFMGAEFLRAEYQDTAPWVGVAGYCVATCTGILRIYNNRHYLSDVLAGAGFGILSTRIAYLVYPALKRTFSKSAGRGCDVTAVPYCDSRTDCFGGSLAISF